MTFTLLVIMTLLFTAQTLFCKLYSGAYRGKRSASASGVYSILFGSIIGLVTLALNGFAFAPSGATVVLGILNAAVLYVYNTSFVRGSVMGSYGLLMVCSLSGNMLLPVFWDALYNGTPITFIQIISLILLLLSFVLMNSGEIRQKSQKGFFLCCAILFLTNGIFGTILNMQQQLSAGAQRAEMVVITYLGMAVAVLILTFFRDRHDFTDTFRMGKKAFLYAAVSCCVATAASNLKVYLITRSHSLTLLYAFSNGGMVVACTVLAAILFREKLTLPRIVGIILSCTGITLLCL